MNDCRGSIWRKWDLHLHTPSSYDYDDKSMGDEKIIDGLVQAEIAAVTITDHHLIDVQRIKKLQELGRGQITVFPGIELRSELGGKRNVHFIGIFPENSDLEDIWRRLDVHLNLTKQKEKEGDEAVFAPLKKAADLIRAGLSGLVSVHAGRKEGSIEEISNSEEVFRAVKRDLAESSIDILEVVTLKDRDSYYEKVFPNINKILPLVKGSDNHNIASYILGLPCWIKADPTFAGLRQVLNEPRERVFFGHSPPLLERVRRNKTKYVRALEIRHAPQYGLDEIWFDNRVEFNPGFVAIIGNRGSGKSALTDTLGLLGNSSRSDSFSFLSQKQFKRKKSNKAKHFTATLEWESGTTEEKNLNDDVQKEAVETIKYIPQNHLEDICNELSEPGKGRFDQELKEVIFSHVSEVDRLGKESLDGLIKHHTETTYEAIRILKDELEAINQEIVLIEEHMTEQYSTALKNQLEEQQRILEAHNRAKPTEQREPDHDSKAQEEASKIVKEIDEKRETIRQIEKCVEGLTNTHLQCSKKVSAANRLLSKLENFRKEYNKLKSDSKEDLECLSVDIENIIKIEFHPEILTELRKELINGTENLAGALNPLNQDGIAFRKSEKEKEIELLSQKMNEPNQRYQAYLTSLEEWNKKRSKIIGNKETVGTIEYLRYRLGELESAPERLRQNKERRTQKAQEIYNEKKKLTHVYAELYLPVEKFIEEHPIAQEFGLNFNVSISNYGFEAAFLEDYISHGKRGSFYGIEDGRKQLNQILETADFDSQEGALTFIENIIQHLSQDIKSAKGDKITITSQLRERATLKEFYNFIFSLDYLKPRYSLQLSHRDMQQLSPGERGTLLLIFYLLVDKSEIPLVIDQPEGNLDNETVFSSLVPCIREARNRRQVIIVTHNPNLAVTCDADQIIRASIDKQKQNEVTYVAGAIENPGMNLNAVNILEGTKPAFKNRDSKYKIVSNSS